MAKPRDSKPLTPSQLADAERLRQAFERARKKDRHITQEWLAEKMDGLTQSAISHFMTGRKALNLRRVLDFSRLLGVPPQLISPELCRPLTEAVAPPSAAENAATYATLTEAERELIDYVRKQGVNDEHRSRIARTALLLLRALVENAVPDHVLEANGWNAAKTAAKRA